MLCGNDVCALGEESDDIFDIDIVADLIVEIPANEREHAPVYEVGAVALGGIFGCNVGNAAKDALA